MAAARLVVGLVLLRRRVLVLGGGQLQVLVADVGVGDLAVALVLGDGGAVRGEPLACGDLGSRVDVVGVAGGELGLGPLSGGPGAGGVGQPARSGVVELTELVGLLLEGLGQRAGLIGLVGEATSLGLVGSGVGFGSAQLFGLAVGCEGLVGAGELVADVAGGPGGFALVGADSDAKLAVGELELFAVDLGAA
ncbi:hypothetical protein [Actinomycetospora flava]|uniref:Uncharacterized protein n=1 Tax=Actinomycetospora flava TaxID=3129232 RepID=A0ABU8MDA2_9PSEU